MKIKKYATGGGGLIYTPFIPEQWAQQGRSDRSSSASEEDAKIDPLDEKLISLMKDQNLLPSDIQLIYDRILQFQMSSQKLSSTGLTGSNTYRSVMPGMLQIMNLVNQAKSNKEEFDHKLTEIRKHDAGSEVALDSYGRMWVLDKSNGDLKKINPSQYDKEEFQPVSNSQLMYYRQTNPELAFQTLFGDTGMDVVGGNDVRKEIKEIIDSFGTIKKGELKKGNFSEIAQDLQGEGIFKLTTKYSKADLEDFSKLLYMQLSTPSKHLVDANAAIGGYDPLKYIYSIIVSQTDVEVDAPEYQASLTKAAGAGGPGGSGADGEDTKNLVEDTYISQLVKGNNMELPRLTKFNPTSKISITAYIQNAGVLNEDDGKTKITPGVLDAIFEKVSLKDISPQYTVTFGDQVVDEKNLGQIMYDGSAVQRVKLPYTTVNGEVTVDWSTIEAAENLNKQLSEKEVTPGMIKEMLKDHPILAYDERLDRVVAKNSKWFITFGAMAANDYNKNIDFKNTKYLEKMSDDKADFWHPKYEEAVKYGFVNHDKNAPKRTSTVTDKTGIINIGGMQLGKFDWTNTKYYHGNVFIPILRESAGSPEYYPKSSRMHNAQTQAMNDRSTAIQEQVDTGQRSFNW